MKDCGDCTFCCSVLDVPSIEKPRNTQCPHACPGCRIYDSRPPECRAFECLWRFGGLHDRMRPDKCGVVFELFKPEKTVVATVDAFRPSAWRQGVTGKLVERMVVDGYSVWIVSGKEKHLLLPKGQTQEKSLDQLKEVWSRQWQPQPTQPTSPL